MNKKAFTLIELLSVIVLLAILVTFAFFSYTRYLKSSRRRILEVDIKSMESAARNAINECHKGSSNNFCNNFTIPEDNVPVKIQFRDLVSNSYADEFKNPYEKGTYCDTDASYVMVTRKINDDKADISFDYSACLICGNDQDQARTTMAKIMKKRGISNTDIIACTGLSQNQIENLEQ